MTKTHDQIRKSVDGNDSFMTGFQIGQLKTYKRKIPLWVNSDKEIQKILLSAFPKLKTDSRQRTRAARWANVIHFYFRLRYTASQIADELGFKPSVVYDIVFRIKRAAAGQKANGSGPRG